jgi:hypothetical protein
VIIAGTFAVATGSVKLISDFAGHPDVADRAPDSYLGTVAKLTGSKSLEVMSDLVEGFALGAANPIAKSVPSSFLGAAVDEVVGVLDASGTITQSTLQLIEEGKASSEKFRPGKNKQNLLPISASTQEDTLDTGRDTSRAVSSVLEPLSVSEPIKEPAVPVKSLQIQVVNPANRGRKKDEEKGGTIIHPGYKGVARLRRQLKRLFQK